MAQWLKGLPVKQGWAQIPNSHVKAKWARQALRSQAPEISSLACMWLPCGYIGSLH